jgi:hypothetical protein
MPSQNCVGLCFSWQFFNGNLFVLFLMRVFCFCSFCCLCLRPRFLGHPTDIWRVSSCLLTYLCYKYFVQELPSPSLIQNCQICHRWLSKRNIFMWFRSIYKSPKLVFVRLLFVFVRFLFLAACNRACDTNCRVPWWGVSCYHAGISSKICSVCRVVLTPNWQPQFVN